MWYVERHGKKYLEDRYTDPMTGDIKSVSVMVKKDSPAGRKDAQIKLEKKILELQNTDHKLSEVMKLYIQYQERSVKESTRRRNQYALNSILEMVGDIYMNKMTAGYIMDKFMTSGREMHTLNEFIKRFKAMLNWAYRHDYLNNYDVYKKLDTFPDISKAERNKYKFLEADEVRKLLDEMDNECFKLLTQFLVLSGLRIGEAIALNKFDVTDTNIIVTKTSDSETRTIGTPKTMASNREVSVNAELLQCINKIRALMKEQRALYGYPANEFFFCSPTGDRILYRSYSYYLSAKSDAILQHRITPHALRHTSVSLFAEQGLPIDVISRRMGHNNSRVTKDIYEHVTRTLKKKDAEMVSKVTLIG